MGGPGAGHDQPRHDVPKHRPCWLAAKKKTVFASEQDPAERAAWWQLIAAVNPADLLFVDETGLTINMARRYSRAPGKSRAVGYVPRNHAPATTLITTLTPEGLGPLLTLRGAVNSDVCAVFAEQVLAPALRSGQVVCMDRLSSHTDARVRAAIEGVGCRLLLLPAYSPDYSPAELAISKVKAEVRREPPRSQEALDEAITRAIGTVTATDAQGWFKHCGYPLDRST